jgi:catechol 2,3-dioxygenase-like lactoylglutathione lyase family enzyme
MTRPRASFAHLALRVADLERQSRFYCEVLGFEAATPYEAGGAKVATFMDVSARSFRGRFLRRAGFHLELLQYEPTRPGRSRDADEVGIAHLSFVVDNIAEVAERVLEAGGQMLTQMDQAFGATTVRFAFCADPDGNRIELVEYTGDADPAPHAGFLGMRDFGWPPALA